MGCAGDVARAMTRGRVDDAGGRWTWTLWWRRWRPNAPRVRCPEHGVVVAAVPWARHGAGHTRFFDDQVAWLAVACSKSAVTELTRIAWRTVGAIVTRVAEDAMAGMNRFAGVRRWPKDPHSRGGTECGSTPGASRPGRGLRRAPP